MLNKVMIIGRLGMDPELRYTPNGFPIGSLRVATDDTYTDREGNRVERTEWHRVVVFQKTAENCKHYLRKGSLVYVEGKIQTRKWQDQSGQDRYSTEIRADRVQFLDRRNSESTGVPPDGYQPEHEDLPPSLSSGVHKNLRTMEEDLGPAFPSEVNKASSSMDDIPF